MASLNVDQQQPIHLEPAAPRVRRLGIDIYRELLSANRMLYAEMPLPRYLDEIRVCQDALARLEYGGDYSEIDWERSP